MSLVLLKWFSKYRILFIYTFLRSKCNECQTQNKQHHCKGKCSHFYKIKTLQNHKKDAAVIFSHYNPKKVLLSKIVKYYCNGTIRCILYTLLINSISIGGHPPWEDFQSINNYTYRVRRENLNTFISIKCSDFLAAPCRSESWQTIGHRTIW